MERGVVVVVVFFSFFLFSFFLFFWVGLEMVLGLDGGCIHVTGSWELRVEW